jgi:hypothetical protein
MADNNTSQTVEYGDQGPVLQPIHVLPLTPAGWPILPPPVSPDVVMSYARAMRDDRHVSAIMSSMGKWGLPNRSELQLLEQFRDEWIVRNRLQDHGLNAYFGANMVFRRIAWGQISSLDDPRAMAFLHEDEPRNTGGPVTSLGVPPRLDEVMWLANYVIECCNFWGLYADDWRNRGVVGRYYAGQVYFDGFYREFYCPKYGYYNRGLKVFAKTLLSAVACKQIEEIGSLAAWKFVQEDKMSIVLKLTKESLI